MKFKLVIWSCLMTLTVMAQTPALIVKEIHQRMEKNTEDLPSLIKEMDVRLTQTTDPALQAIYHTMQADMVQQDYMLHRRTVEDRINTHSQQPTVMREWDTQDYRHKIKTNLLASLLPADLLKKTPLRTYKNLITPQNFTSTTLYEFLAQEALSHPALTKDTQYRDSIYQALLRFQYQKTSPLAGLMTELTYLNQTQQHVKIQHQKLDSLLQHYADKPYAVEIVERLAQIASRDSASQAYIYHLCQLYIQRFPDYPRLALLKNRLNTMERPQLRLRAPLQSYPGELWKVSIYHTHLPQLTLRLKDANQHILMEKELTFTEHNPYSNYKDSVLLPLKKNGLYYCTLTSKDKQLNKTLPVHVSRLNIVDRTLATVHECWVTDFKTGRPVAQAQVKIYKYENQNPRYIKTYSTDKKGLLFLSADSLQKIKNFGYKPIIKGDTAAPITRRYPYFSSQTPQKAHPNLAVFMDRGLYRPGQLIQFKAIATLTDHENQHVLPNENYTITLRDSNQKELKQTTLRTNDFGSIAGSFLLPTHQLNGWYQLVFEGNGRTSTSFRVESYKRPTFKIKIRPLEGELSMGQKIPLQGQLIQLAGGTLNTGQVQYTITRSPWWYNRYRPTNAEEIVRDKVDVTKDGTFHFDFTPQPKENWPFNTYEVTTRYTDSKGETQTDVYTFRIGNQGFILQTSLKPLELKNECAPQINATAINGKQVNTTVHYTLYAFNRKTHRCDRLIHQGTSPSNQKLDNRLFSSLASGKYRLHYQATDQQKRLLKGETTFVLYSPKDRTPPTPCETWLPQDTWTLSPGETAPITFGTSFHHVYVLKELVVNQRVVSRSIEKINNQIKKYPIRFSEKFKQEAMMNFTFVRNGQLYQRHVRLIKKKPDLNLQIQVKTQRDHLTPGTQETWQITVTDAHAKGVSSEMVAALYDAALDALHPYAWHFNPLRTIHVSNPTFTTSKAFDTTYTYWAKPTSYISYPSYRQPTFDWQGAFDFYQNRPLLTLTGNSMMRLADEATPIKKVMSMTEETVKATSPILRQNFKETAFFKPFLYTNKEGQCQLTFTVPESHTTWKFQALAHTQDLHSGLYSKEIVANKPLMIVPNLPRFIREGDQVSISAQVMNLTAQKQKGHAILRLLDATTKQPLTLTDSLVHFEVTAHQTAAVRWSLSVPSGHTLLLCEVKAVSTDASDGERHWLPVISNKEHVTETQLIYFNHPQKQQFTLPAEGHHTLELSGNPTNYALWTLPSLATPSRPDAFSLSAAYYSLVIGHQLLAARPALQELIRQVQSTSNPQDWHSMLQRNTELKNILLEQTPWILEAENETEQLRTLALWLDENTWHTRFTEVVTQLLDQQSTTGSWRWFKGMKDSPAVTLAVVKRLTQQKIQRFTFQQTEIQAAIEKAIHYLDHIFEERAEKENNRVLYNQPFIIDYLYLRSQYPQIKTSESCTKLLEQYNLQALNNWKKAAYKTKPTLALLALQTHQKALAQTITNWFRRTATHSATKGMYWANNRQNARAVHVQLMQLFQQVGTPQERTQLQQWLLNQKRTQSWANIPSTLAAIAVLLEKSDDYLLTTDSMSYCRATLGSKQWDTQHSRSGIDYIKQAIPPSTSSSTSQKLVIEKMGKGPAWGAIYTQRLASNATLTSKGSESLRLNKKIFVSHLGNDYHSLEKGETIHVGDRLLIRMILNVDQALDYVHVQDKRMGCESSTTQQSETEAKGNLVYYHQPNDLAEHFFIEHLPKGTHTIAYEVEIQRAGVYTGGISTVQSLYAPEITAHSKSYLYQVTQ